MGRSDRDTACAFCVIHQCLRYPLDNHRSNCFSLGCIDRNGIGNNWILSKSNISEARDEALKSKKKVIKYQREFGKQLKKLKAKHPKTLAKNLMKRAHTATKRALK